MAQCDICGKTMSAERLQRIDSGENVCADCLAKMRELSKKPKPALLIRIRAYCQTVVLWLGIAVIVVMLLFPPWIAFTEGYTQYRDGKIHKYVVSHRRSLGCHFITRPPSMLRPPSDFMWDFATKQIDELPADSPLQRDLWDALEITTLGQCYLDVSRLIVQCGAVALVTAGGIYTLQTKGK